jgi:7-carboxy-7-deazaguanine synthase
MSDISFLINEIYPCLQGEGPNLGQPSVLIRMQICNLRCDWCDTKYTHTFRSDPKNVEDPQGIQNFQRMTSTDIMAQLDKHPHIRHLILSGGEPTLQNISALMLPLRNKGFTAEVETNGTRIPHLDLAGFPHSAYDWFQWNVSPKGQNAGEKLSHRALSHWAELLQSHAKVYFKFVIRKDHALHDLEEVLALQKKYSLNQHHIFLMPEGTTQDSQLGNTWLHDLCLERGYRYTPRLHLLLFGPRRGV